MALTGLNDSEVRTVISWQEVSGFRVWMASKSTKNGYQALGIEFQFIGTGIVSKGPSDNEINLRLQSASLSKNEVNPELFNPSTLRNLSIGQIMDANAFMLTKVTNEIEGTKNTSLRIVKDFLKFDYTQDLFDKTLSKSPKSKNALRASVMDSLLIAKIYSDQTENGNRRPAKSTAEFLSMDVNLVYVAVRNARKFGWLSTSGFGVGGGTLTKNGKEEFKKRNGQRRLIEYLESIKERGK